MNIVLTELIREQAFECLIMFGAGAAMGILYQICSFLSGKVRVNRWIRMGAELLFCLAAAILFSQFLYYCAYGSLSLHTITAFGAGVLLWMKFFCGIIIPDKKEEAHTRGLRKRNGKEKKKQSV